MFSFVMMLNVCFIVSGSILVVVFKKNSCSFLSSLKPLKDGRSKLASCYENNGFLHWTVVSVYLRTYVLSAPVN